MTLYSLIIKKVFLVDIISIAIGYMLRVYGGAIIIVYNIDETINVSIWLILHWLCFIICFKHKRFSEITNDKLTSRSSLVEINLNYYNSINLNELLTYISYSFYCVSINFPQYSVLILLLTYLYYLPFH